MDITAVNAKEIAGLIVLGIVIVGYIWFGASTAGYLAAEKHFGKLMYLETYRKKIRGRYRTKKRLVVKGGRILEVALIFLFWWIANAVASGQGRHKYKQPLSNEETVRLYRERANEAMTYYGSGVALSDEFKAAWRDYSADLTAWKNEIDTVLLNSSPVKLAEMYRKGAKIEGLKYIGFDGENPAQSSLSATKLSKKVESVTNELFALSQAITKAHTAVGLLETETEKKFDRLNRKIDTGLARTETVKKEIKQTKEALVEQYIVVEKDSLEGIVSNALDEAGVRKGKANAALETIREAIVEKTKDEEKKE